VLQLDLRKLKKRKRKAPPPLEFTLHVMVAEVLRRWRAPGWEWTHMPFGEKRHIATAKRLKRMGVKPGWPDFLFAGCDRPGAPRGQRLARMAFLELKRKGNDLNDNQQHIMLHLEWCGFDYLVTDSFDEAVSWLKRLGILPATVKVQ
jgi:hypothetical protein